jgi:serine/threonine protein kinase
MLPGAWPCSDFDFDDVGFGSPVSPLPDNRLVLTLDDHRDLFQAHDLSLVTQVPIRCTTNSIVYKATSSDGGRLAAKLMLNPIRAQREFANREQIPDNPFLVRTVALHQTATKSLLVMDECEGGDLRSVQLLEPFAWQLLNNVAVGLIEIHSAGYMHLDISPGNILQTSDVFKVADFGTLKRIGEFREGDEGAGPYVSPEALAFPHNESPVTSQTDIFSLGVVLLEVVSGKMAPRGGSAGYGLLRSGGIRLGFGKYPCTASRRMIHFVNRMLSNNPAERPTTTEIIEETSTM